MSYIGNKPASAALTASDIADDIISLAKMAGGTDGNIITYDASGNPAVVATGSDGQVLTSTGAGSPPAFEAVSGGKVLQIVEGSTTTETGISSTSYATSTLSASITCSATSSKVLVIVAQNITAYINTNAHRSYYNALFRGTTNINTRGSIIGGGTSANGYFYAAIDGSIAHLDSPSSTSELTYSTQGYVSATASTTTIRFNTNSSRSTIQLIEIGA